MRGLPGGASSVKFLTLVSGADVLTTAEHKTFVDAFSCFLSLVVCFSFLLISV